MATTTESLTALRFVLEATHMNANYKANPGAHMSADDAFLAMVTGLFAEIVGPHVAQRLADWFNTTKASPEDAHRIAIADDQVELKMLAGIIGIGQQR